MGYNVINDIYLGGIFRRGKVLLGLFIAIGGYVEVRVRLVTLFFGVRYVMISTSNNVLQHESCILVVHHINYSKHP